MIMKPKETTLKEICSLYIKDMVLINGIVEVDPEFQYAPFEYEEFLNLEESIEIYQYYATNLIDSQVKFLVEKYHLLFKYSETLDVFFFCVDHFGNPWDNIKLKEYNSQS